MLHFFISTMAVKASIDKITNTLNALQRNGMNISATSRETGVSEVSIRKWKRSYPEILNELSLSQERIITTIEANTISLRKDIMARAGSVISSALNKANELLANETDLLKVSRVLKDVSEITIAMEEMVNRGASGEDPIGESNGISSTLERLGNTKIEDAELCGDS